MNELVAITLGLGTFAATIGVLTLLMLGVAVLRLRPTRPCHLCGERVLVEARRCKRCGYEFSRFRGVNS